MPRLRRARLAAPAALLVAVAIALTIAPSVAPSAGRQARDAASKAKLSAADAPRQRCFGAAARDPERPCFNRLLRRIVVPTPEEAKAGQNSACQPDGRTEELYPCLFGTPWTEAVGTIALVGDSHAAHWRAALEVVALKRGWHGISLTQTGCPMTKAVPILKGRTRDDCLEYNEAIGPWLERHPEVKTVFTSQHGGKVVAERGQSQRDAQVEGFRRAFSELPPSVEHVIVIRDTPWSTGSAPACIEAALAAGKRTDTACAIPRKRALRVDLAAEAATLMRDPRVEVLDLTPFMCGPDKCFPVVGGALVHKDGGHVTQVFSRTLGPYLGRYVDRVLPPGR
jgi:hypothetical protein